MKRRRASVFAGTYLFFRGRRKVAGDRVETRQKEERRDESSVGPEGALDFHYAKPQMESCDRVSLCATPAGAQSRWNKAPKV